MANRVTVTRESAAEVGELIEAAIAAGANEANRLVVLRRRSRRGAEARGLELAFASARAKAETLAALASQPLGEALCVSESAASRQPDGERRPAG